MPFMPRPPPIPEEPPPLAGGASRAAIFALPIFSVIVSALVFLGPGSMRSITAARVRGAPAEGARSAALRIEVVRSFHDVVDAADAAGLLVEASAPGQALAVERGEIVPGGVVDVVLRGAAPIRGPVAIAVTAPGRGALAAGAIALRRPPPAFVQLGAVRGAARGDLTLRVDALRGVMASPFPEALRVAVAPAGSDGPLGARAEITLSGAGIDLSADHLTTDERGVATVVAKALAHNVELTVTARAGDRTGRWEGVLPVVPGAVWLDPSSPPGTLTLVSPAPRDRAYLSLWSEEGRVFGAVVPLARDGLGFFRGRVAAALPPARLLYATVAGDPLEQGSGTVAWPLRPAEGAVSGGRGLDLLLDGLPAVIEREKQRAFAARRAGLILIGLAGLAEVLLVLAQSRASQRRLEAHLARATAASADGEALPAADRARVMASAREHPVMRAVLVAALVALGFAMAAALATFR